ncbi:LytR C-terminal domain-containing protein [Patescibacteria group bacterium]|nr:LytR C-terminal domain-containing protein [Patescibacteria group bacterium]
MARRKLPSLDSRRGSRPARRGSQRKRTSRVRKKDVSAKSFTLLKSGLTFAAIVALLIVVVVGYRVATRRVWTDSARVSFVLQESDPSSPNSGVYVVSYLSSQEQLVIVSFPEGMKIEAVGGFGPWRVESLYPLGEMQEKGGELLHRSFAEFFGVGVEGWLVTDKVGVEMSRGNARSILRRIFGRALIGKARTNFGLWDLFRLWNAIGAVRLHNVELVDLSRSGAVVEQSQPDGSVTFTADLELLDQLSRRLFSHPELIEEGVAVAVLNGTNHRGLGARVARIVRNMGGDVVVVSDYSRTEEMTTLWASQDDLLKNSTTRQLSKALFIERALVGETSQQRADILVVVGEDYWTRLTKL